MTNPLRTDSEYEFYLYSLVDLFPSVQRSTVSFVRLGTSLARVAGELHFG